MRTRPGYLRLALAVLALVGQLTPAVALPVVVSARLVSPRGACAATGSASCACSPVEQIAAACCCSEPKPAPEPPKPKKTSCCDALDAPKKATSCCSDAPPEPKPAPAKPHAAKAEPKFAAQIVAGGKCTCEKPAPLANAEPASPHAHSDAITFDAASAPHVSRGAAVVAADLPAPPSPPPRA